MLRDAATARPRDDDDRERLDTAVGRAASERLSEASSLSSEALLAEICSSDAVETAALPRSTVFVVASRPATAAAPSRTTTANRCLRGIGNLLVGMWLRR